MSVCKVKDNGFDALMVKVRGASGAIKVGVDSRPHEPSGTPCDVIGAVHEYGLGHVPERSFLRAWVDTNYDQIKEELAHWIQASLVGKLPWREALSGFGEWCVAGIQERMRIGIAPELDPKTVARKESKGQPNVPLIATEQLVNAVIFELHERV